MYMCSRPISVMWKEVLQLLALLALAGAATPTGTECQWSDGFPSPDQLTTILAGDVVHRNTFGRQWLFPEMTFSCEGGVSKWIIGAEWVNTGTSYPEIQIWRLIQPPISSEDAYELIGSVELRITEESPNSVYEYTVDPPMQFLAGDVVGVFQPRNELSRIQLYFEEGQRPTSFFHFIDEPFSPFIPAVVRQDVATPLIAVEIASSSPVPTSQAGPEVTAPSQEVEHTEGTPQVNISQTPTSVVQYSYHPVATITPDSTLYPTVTADITELTHENSSPSGSSDQLIVGVSAGVAVGTAIGVILVVIFVAVVCMWRRRSKDRVLSTPEVQENQAYGTVVHMRPGMVKNPSYNTPEAAGHNGRHHRVQTDPRVDVIDNPQRGAPHGDLTVNGIPEDYEYSYPYAIPFAIHRQDQ